MLFIGLNLWASALGKGVVIIVTHTIMRDSLVMRDNLRMTDNG